MQYLPGRRELALVAALAFATAGSAFAQDTTEAGGAPMDTTQPAAGALDTAGVDSSAISLSQLACPALAASESSGSDCDSKARSSTRDFGT